MINFNNVEVKVVERYDSRHIEIWVIEYQSSKILNYSFKDNQLYVTEMQELEIPAPGTKIEPFLVLPTHFAMGLIKQLSEYNSKQGIKTKDESLLEGKLEATGKHLEDMREFAKKLLDNITK